jgi:hypothetical protein
MLKGWLFFLIYAIGSRVDLEQSHGPYERLSSNCKVDLEQSHNPTAGYKITYSVAALSYDNCYANLRDYSNSLLCDSL